MSDPAPRPASSSSRPLLRAALALARDALLDPSENLRGDLQDALGRLLGEPTRDGPEDAEALEARLAGLQRAVAAVTTRGFRLCVLCGEADGQVGLVEVEDGRTIAIHGDLPHCALLGFTHELRAWIVANRFDDDQDPGLDTPSQRLIRAYDRVVNLVGGDGYAHTAMVSCDVCEAVGYGNATCWCCVSHWGWMAPEVRRQMVAMLIDRPPGRPCGPEEVRAFLGRLDRTSQAPATASPGGDGGEGSGGAP